MRISIELPDELVAKAMAVTQCRTKTLLFKTALETVVRQHELARLKDYCGKVDLDIDLDVTRKRR